MSCKLKNKNKIKMFNHYNAVAGECHERIYNPFVGLRFGMPTKKTAADAAADETHAV